MRSLLLILPCSFSITALSLGGCSNDADNCKNTKTCAPDATGGNGGTGGTGGTTTVDPGCIPSQTPNPVRSDCGVFVSSSLGSDANDDARGSQAKPYATIDKALASPKSGPIYLCAETFTEAVQVGGGATIYGGLDCTAGWTWIGATKKSEISPDAGQIPLVLEPNIGVMIEDVAFRAKDAVAPGGSSIAIVATSGSDLELVRCDVEAGNAKDGSAGETFGMIAAGGMMGNAGGQACSAAMIFGGGSVQNACDEADANDNSVGGSGGVGEEFSGGAGSPGGPVGTINAGAGELASACTPGTAGDEGSPGESAGGGQGVGTISASGFSGVPGASAEKGKTAQGGGGGGGAKGGIAANQCPMANSAGGASGGSGGSGGCGGAGGKGGQAGGASIGIVSLGATLTFADVKITAKNGGKGGDGGMGQLGGMGGPGGAGGSKGAATALKDGCSGGPGGTGGNGGRGGGGLGGHSIGIAYTGNAPPVTTPAITIGSPGAGGAGEGDSGTGAAGIAQPTRLFD